MATFIFAIAMSNVDRVEYFALLYSQIVSTHIYLYTSAFYHIMMNKDVYMSCHKFIVLLSLYSNLKLCLYATFAKQRISC